MAHNTNKRMLSPDDQQMKVSKLKLNLDDVEPGNQEHFIAHVVDDRFMEKIQQAIKELLETILPGLVQNAIMSAMKEIHDQLLIVMSDTEKLKSDVCQVQEAVVETKNAVRSLKIHVDELDQVKRSSSVVFLNEWPESKTESTLSLVQNYIQEALHIDVHDNDISRRFRMGRNPKRSSKPRPVLLHFAFISTKTAVLLARRRLQNFVSGNFPRPVFINEDLTACRQTLFAQYRKMKKEGKIADCWTQNGRIYTKSLTCLVRAVDVKNPDPGHDDESEDT